VGGGGEARWTGRRREEEEENFWFGTFAMLFVPLGVLLVMKTLEDEWHVIAKSLHKFSYRF